MARSREQGSSQWPTAGNQVLRCGPQPGTRFCAGAHSWEQRSLQWQQVTWFRTVAHAGKQVTCYGPRLDLCSALSLIARNQVLCWGPFLGTTFFAVAAGNLVLHCGPMRDTRLRAVAHVQIHVLGCGLQPGTRFCAVARPQLGTRFFAVAHGWEPGSMLWPTAGNQVLRCGP